jgi:hypothetical protein
MMIQLRHFCVAYLDDFCVVDPAESCARVMGTLVALLAELGLPLQEEKFLTEGIPSTCITFLGIEVDSVTMELRLPEDKKIELRRLLQNWRGRSRARVREIQSLAGTLGFAASVIRPARLYTARIFEALRGHSGPQTWVPLSREFQEDVTWWQQVGVAWSGKAIIPSTFPLSPAAAEFYTDASDVGFGGVFHDRFFAGTWTAEERALVEKGELDINVRELVALVFAVELFGAEMTGMHVVARCDNTAAVAVVDRLSARSRNMLHLLRRLHYLQCKWDITLFPLHIPGVENTLADALSRGLFDIFFSLVSPAVPVQVSLSPASRRWQD